MAANPAPRDLNSNASEEVGTDVGSSMSSQLGSSNGSSFIPQLQSTNYFSDASYQQYPENNVGGSIRRQDSANSVGSAPRQQPSAFAFGGISSQQPSMNPNALTDDNEELGLPAEFRRGGRYSLVHASHHPCMEWIHNKNRFCGRTGTYRCDHRDHRYSSPHYVCHACRVAPHNYFIEEEEDMIKKYRIYLCDECTDTRSRLPAAQVWKHPRIDPDEIKVRRVDTCLCHDRLQKNWICKEHRVIEVSDIVRWGDLRTSSFLGFWQKGIVCPSCRGKACQDKGPTLMWQCQACQGLVITEEQDGKGKESHGFSHSFADLLLRLINFSPLD